MRRFRAITIALLGAPLVALFFGCTTTEDETTPGSQGSAGSAANSQEAVSEQGKSQAHTEGVRFTDVLASWESGDKDDAVKQLVSIQWDDPAVFSDLPLLTVSEDGFMSLPADDRARMQKESITLRDLARHALTVGDEAQASGDTETAKTHYEAVRHFGAALSSPERLLVIQMVGKAISSMAEDKASAVE